ncbi:MAG: hypothetical protein ACJAZO_004083, partial [Myxococcota bacterium]
MGSVLKDRKHQPPPEADLSAQRSANRHGLAPASPSTASFAHRAKQRFMVGFALEDTPLRVHSTPPPHVRLRPHPSRWSVGLVPTARATP